METYDLKPIRKVTGTPLSNAFFSEFNRQTIHKSIRESVKRQTGQAIDRQNDQDLQVLMKVVYTDMANDMYTDIRNQVAAMNNETVIRATGTIRTGLLQQAFYMRDISQNRVPNALPVSSSNFGTDINTNYNFGL